MKTIRFVVSVYGDKYLDFLIPNLQSITESNPQANITVVWQQVDPKRIQELSRAYPKVECIKNNIAISGTQMQMIPQKIRLWQYASAKYLNEPICFIDVDMLVVKSVTHYFKKNFDILYTHKQERWPFNTGTVFIKNSKKVQNFFSHWLKQILLTINDPELIERANKLDGAADQYTLREFIGRDADYTKPILQKLGKDKLIFLGIPCTELNETNSVKPTKKSHILHYKGGWHGILLDGEAFSKYRPEEKSMPMFKIWYQHYKRAAQRLAKLRPSPIIALEEATPAIIRKQVLTGKEAHIVKPDKETKAFIREKLFTWRETKGGIDIFPDRQDAINLKREMVSFRISRWFRIQRIKARAAFNLTRRYLGK